MIAYHFPPIKGSSGYLRTLKFAKYLPGYGVEPTVLTVNERAYEETDPGLAGQVPAGVHVERCFALDARRHLAIRGRYPSFLAIPDRIATWIPSGILAGLRLIRTRRIDAIFSTYPIPSAHVIALALSRLTRKPWLADFRDPMWDEYVSIFAKGELKARKAIERAALRGCMHATVTTEGMRDLFLARYVGIEPGRISVIPNGFDEADFHGLEPVARRSDAPVTFVHAGLLDPVDRNPAHFYLGLKRLKEEGRLRGLQFKVDMYTPGKLDGLRAEIAALGLEKIVRVLPPVPYKEALRAMAMADVLLLFQGPSCENQIPAKLYEYFRIGKPILALTTESGETGKLIRANAAGLVVPIDASDHIAETVERCVTAVSNGIPLPAAGRERAATFSRQSQAASLAARLAVVSGRS